MTDDMTQDTENGILTYGQIPKDGRTLTSATNGKLGGRPKGSGVKALDWGKYQRLGLDGLSLEAVARQLGISRRTFARRKRQRQCDDSPM